MPKPIASIIVPLFNQVGFTKVCVDYVMRNSTDADFEFILVDNGSSDGTPEFLSGLPSHVVRIRNDVNLGFAKACNQGARAASTPNLVFLNNDTAPHRGWLRKLLDAHAQPGVGMVGPKLVYPDFTIQQAGVVFHMGGLPYHLYLNCPADLPGANKSRRFQALTGACLLVSKADFWSVGGFEEAYLNGLEDIDFCLKLGKAGKAALYEPASVVTHFESRSENRNRDMGENTRIFCERWTGAVITDDFKYLAEDGMGVYLPTPSTFAFDTVDGIRVRLEPVLAEVRRLEATGDVRSTLKAYTDLMNMFFYSPAVLSQMLEYTRRIGEMGLANMIQAKLTKCAPPAHPAHPAPYPGVPVP